MNESTLKRDPSKISIEEELEIRQKASKTLMFLLEKASKETLTNDEIDTLRLVTSIALTQHWVSH